MTPRAVFTLLGGRLVEASGEVGRAGASEATWMAQPSTEVRFGFEGHRAC